jgi:hypothetical protein
MGQPYYFLMTGLDDQNRTHPEYDRILNNGYIPPRAGDILVAKGPAEGEFHTALFQAVQGSSVTIFQANVASVISFIFHKRKRHRCLMSLFQSLNNFIYMAFVCSCFHFLVGIGQHLENIYMLVFLYNMILVPVNITCLI